MHVHALRQRWMQFWFLPQSPVDLAVCRILFYGAVFVLYLGVDPAGWAGVSSVFWRPTFFFAQLHLPVLGASALLVASVVWKAALLCCCLGLWTRASTVAAFVLGFYVLGLPHSMGKVHHFDAILVLIFGVMLLARCGDALSLDRVLRRATRPAPPSGEYRWPIRMIWLIIALIFVAAGVAKLRASGLAWVTSPNMATLLIKQQYPTSAPPPLVDWGIAIAQQPWLCHALAAGALALEVCYPLALVSRRLRLLIVPGMLAAQVGIRVLMGPSFEQFFIASVFWVPWSALLLAAQTRFAPVGRAAPREYDTDIAVN